MKGLDTCVWLSRLPSSLGLLVLPCVYLLNPSLLVLGRAIYISIVVVSLGFPAGLPTPPGIRLAEHYPLSRLSVYKLFHVPEYSILWLGSASTGRRPRGLLLSSSPALHRILSTTIYFLASATSTLITFSSFFRCMLLVLLGP